MPQRDCSPLRDTRRCWEVWRGRAKQTKLTGAMDSKDSISKLSLIKYLKRFKYLDKKNDVNVLDIFNVNHRNLKPRNLSREKWRHLFKCLVIAIVLNSYHTSFYRLAYFCPLKGPFKNFRRALHHNKLTYWQDQVTSREKKKASNKQKTQHDTG